MYKSPISYLLSYTDANWGGCPDTRRSTSGYCVFLGDNLISWSAKQQPTVSKSSAEAEYRGVANVVSETCWVRNLLLEHHCPIRTTTLPTFLPKVFLKSSLMIFAPVLASTNLPIQLWGCARIE